MEQIPLQFTVEESRRAIPTRALQRLTEAGLVTEHGRTSGARYQPTPDVRDRLQQQSLARPEQDILDEARNRAEDGVRNADVRELLDVGREEALRLLTRLVDRDLLERRGQRRGTHYVVPDHDG